MGKLAYEYKGIKIYDDTEKGMYYIYTDDKYKKRMDFSNEKDVEEYIDDEENLPIYSYSVVYIDKYNDSSNNCITVEAPSEESAKIRAKNRLGDIIFKIVRVEKLD